MSAARIVLRRRWMEECPPVFNKRKQKRMARGLEMPRVTFADWLPRVPGRDSDRIQLAEDVSEEIRVLPYGPTIGRNADDHVHIDLGFVSLIPREISEDRMEQPQENRPRFAFEERRGRDRRAGAPPEE